MADEQNVPKSNGIRRRASNRNALHTPTMPLERNKMPATLTKVPIQSFARQRELGLKYAHPSAVRRAIQRYFETRYKENVPHTIAGLALALGTTTANLRKLASEETDQETAAIVGAPTYQKIQRDIRRAIAMLGDILEADMRTRSNFTIANMFLLKNLGYTDTERGALTIKDTTGKPIAVQVIRYDTEKTP